MTELERRKRENPLSFAEPANDKVLAFWSSKVKIRALFGGNRSGKTESACIDTLWHLRGEHPYQPVPPPPVRWRVEVSDFNQLEKVVNEKLRALFPPSLLKGGSWEKAYNERKRILSCSNGSKLDFVTHDQNVLHLEGSALHGVWMDEEPPLEHYKSNLMRTVDYGGRMTFSLTPLQGLTWMWKEIWLKSFINPTVKCWRMSIWENKFLSQEEIKTIEDLYTDEREKNVRLRGMFQSRAGLVFNFDPEIHVYDEPPDWWDSHYPPTHSFIHVVGIDPGWGHPTGVIWVAIDPDTREHWFYGEHKRSEMTPADHAKIIHEKNEVYGLRRPIYFIDPQANAKGHDGNQVVTLYRKEGIFPRLGSKKLLVGNQYMSDLMRHTVDPFGNYETKFHVSAELTDFIDELSSYERKKEIADSDRERFVDKNNDLIAAARYASWGARNMSLNEAYILLGEEKKRIRPEEVEDDHGWRGSRRTGY